METVSEGISQLSLHGTEKRINESEASRKRMICIYCDSEEHLSTWCNLLTSIPKHAYVNPCYVIICGMCGLLIKNDLQCPECKGTVPGRLAPHICEVCGDFCADHSPDSCPNKDRPALLGDYGPLPPDWAPSSPSYGESSSS